MCTIAGIHCNANSLPVFNIPALQIDLNLFGMGNIKLSKVLFRNPLPNRARPTKRGWASLNLTPEYDQEEEGSLPTTAAPDGPSPGGDAEGIAALRLFVWTERSTPSEFRWSRTSAHPRQELP